MLCHGTMLTGKMRGRKVYLCCKCGKAVMVDIDNGGMRLVWGSRRYGGVA